jgi:glycosyltransferase involved in cell wall biosynthesis
MNFADAVAALIPAYREAGRIRSVVSRARGFVGTVLVVDDGSPDDTGGEARRAGAEVIRHPENRGKGAAIKTGFRDLFGRGFEYVIVLDGDGQHRPEEIPRFLQEAGRTGARFLVGNRFADARGMPLVRKLTNLGMSRLLSGCCGQSIPDTQCGFRMIHRDLFPHLFCPGEAYDYESEMLLAIARTKLPIGAVPVSTVYAGEKSKIHPVRDTFRFFRMLWRNRRR